MDDMDAEQVRDWYRRYNEVCNGHRFGELSEFVAEDVVVNGERQGLDGYVAGLQAVVDAFPDYRWELRHLLVEGSWIAAHFVDTGTHLGSFLGVPAAHRPVTTQEFAMYRVLQVGRSGARLRGLRRSRAAPDRRNAAPSVQ